MKSNSSIFPNFSPQQPLYEQNSCKAKSNTNGCNSHTNILLSQFSNPKLNENKIDIKHNHLTDILMNKIGPTYIIGYLGSAILTKGKTGLGCLQQPLRELYFIFRQNGSRLIQERRLVVSSDGLTMLYNELGVEKFIHNDLSSVYDVQLLKLVIDVRKDKKIFGAFLPIEQEPDICYSNLFNQLDKPYIKYLENSSHPPVIALIMRRSTGIQALECHVLITRSSMDATRIVNEIKNICNQYKNELNQQTKVFQYKPYNETLNGINSEISSPFFDKNDSALNSFNSCSSFVKDDFKDQNKISKPVSQLPPKSPFTKTIPNQKKNTNNSKNFDHNENKSQSVIYDAYKDNSQSNNIYANNNQIESKIGSKSSSNISSKNNPSIFSKLKNNIIDKSSLSPTNSKKLPNSSSDSKLKNKDKKTKSLTSNSEIIFSMNKQNPNQTNDNEKNKTIKRRPSSALAGSVNNEEKKQSTKDLKQPSLSSLALSDDGLSVKSGSTYKKEKKLSLGKRIILSARSSLKSNSSVDSKRGSKMLLSNSASSINSLGSQKSASTKSRKDTEKIGDIDFRKSRASILDNNLLIDSSIFGPLTIVQHGNRPTSSSSIIYDNRIRSHTPTSINLENRINLISPITSARPQMNSHVKDANFILKSRSTVASSPNKLTNTPVTKANLQCYQRPASHGPTNRVRNDLISVENSVVEYQKEASNGQNRYQKRVFKYPVTDPKLLSNHLVWNNGSAECLDKNKLEFKKESFSPVAKAISPGGVNSNSSYEIINDSINQKNDINRLNRTYNVENKYTARSKSYSSEYNSNSTNTKIENNFKTPPKPPTSIIPVLSLNYNPRETENHSFSRDCNSLSSEFGAIATGHGKIMNNFNSKSRDSSFSSRLSNNENDERVTVYRTAFSARDKSLDSIQNSLKEKYKNEENIAVLNKLKLQYEDDEERKKSRASLNAHKIVGGVKVFPSLPHQYRQAAEIRKNRFKEIENRLKTNYSPYKSSQAGKINQNNSLTLESSDTDHEIIDLTNHKETRSEIVISSTPKEIPIQILNKNDNRNSIDHDHRTNVNMKTSINYVRPRALLTADQISENQQPYVADRESFNQIDSNHKINYIYYYDNDHFCGY